MLSQILSQIGPYIRRISDIYAFRLVNKYFWEHLPQHILEIRSLSEIRMKPDQLQIFTQLVRISGISIYFESVSKLPPTLKYTDLHISDGNLLLDLLHLNYAPITFYQWGPTVNQKFHLLIRDGVVYVPDHLQNVLNLPSNLEVEYVEDFTLSYKFRSPQKELRVGDRILTLNRYLHFISFELGQLLNLCPGYHQRTVLELALYEFWKNRPEETWTFLEKIILSETFWLSPGQLPDFLSEGQGDLGVEDLEKFVQEENLLLKDFCERLDLSDYLDVIS